MAFGGFDDKRNQAPMADINVTPMVDVMLVLLVIFIITAPLFTQAVKLDLPKAQSQVVQDLPDTVYLAIDAQGKIFWNDQPLAQIELDQRLANAAQKQPQPELRLRADKDTRYEVVAQVMAAAQNNGLTKIGFVTDPKDSTAKP